MEIEGKVIQILPLQQGVGQNGKPWTLRTFIIETAEQYPRKVCIDLFGEDRVKNNPVEIDEDVKVSYDIESREFNGRWYTSIRAWRVDKLNAAETQEQNANEQQDNLFGQLPNEQQNPFES